MDERSDPTPAEIAAGADVMAEIVDFLIEDAGAGEAMPASESVAEIQVIVPPALQGPLREWLSSRGLHLLPIPVEDDPIPTFGIGF